MQGNMQCTGSRLHALLAILLSQPLQEKINNKDKLDKEEYNKELELNKYIEDFRPLDSIKRII